MSKAFPPIIDSDGHIFEDSDAIYRLIPEPHRNEQSVPGKSPFPQLDHFRFPNGKKPPHSFDFRVRAAEWRQFTQDVGIRAAVVYPTFGLGYGRIQSPNFAGVVCRAYNEWVSQAYCSPGSPLKGMAIIPLQSPVAAASELRRAVADMGLLGAMLPSTGFRGYLGDREYWPIYEAANDLGCAIAVHGGAHQGVGLDYMRSFQPVHALGHPFGIMINFASLVFNGVFERFPKVRFAFLEAGVSWLLLCLERFGGSSEAFQHWDPASEGQPLSGRDLTEALIEMLRNGRIFVGIEGDELSLATAVRLVGAKPFVFSSDFPHEVNREICRHEIEELLENDEISQADTEAILYHNAVALYGAKLLSN